MNYKSTSIPFSQINHIQRLYKKEFASVIRYSRFKSIETVDEWIYLLGGDVILSNHGKITDKITQEFIAYNKKNGVEFNNFEETILRTSALIHDWGEVIIEGYGVGDISYDKKRVSDRRREFEVFDKLLTKLPIKKDAKALSKVYYSVCMDRENNLGRIFNAVERVGFIKNAIDAYLGKEGKKIKNYKGLVGNVLSNQIIALVDYSKEFPYICQFLKENKTLIIAMFRDILKNKNVPRDAEGGYSYNRKKALSAFNFWKNSGLMVCR